MKEKPVIAAFDFDGTITYRDSFLRFLLFSLGWKRGCAVLCSAFPVMIAYLLGRAGRQEVKEGLLYAGFKGRDLKEMELLGKRFAKQSLPQQVRPQALARIRWHQKQGHRCILVSASLDTYLKPWAKDQGFEAVLASRLAADPAGKVTGRLEGLNCRGPEKVRRLEDYLGSLSTYEIYAYGDSPGDRELLEIAQHSVYRTFSLKGSAFQ